jgi:hypothetical protein
MAAVTAPALEWLLARRSLASPISAALAPIDCFLEIRPE